jgi:hypothetical protein
MKTKNILMYAVFCSAFLFDTASAKNISVPFTSQAPTGNWNQPWQDACEETAITMVDYFYAGKTFTVANAQKSILDAIRVKEKYIGKSLDENAQAVTDMINNFFPFEAYIQDNPTVEEIKNEIDNNHPVIIPAHGKYLLNPNFKNGGPEYHSLVISGYDDTTQEFITEEPGTRKGLDFRYSYDIIMNAAHDYLPDGQTKNGAKIAIFTKPTLDISATTDADLDGLDKATEVAQKTSLWLADSDGDSYKDGYEVDMGFSPILHKQAINGVLLKIENDPKVYYVKNGVKQHIMNEKVFKNHDWNWGQIQTTTQEYLDFLETGLQITK